MPPQPPPAEAGSTPLLVLPKLLQFSVTASGVGWTRFQGLLLLAAGYSPAQIGLLKSWGFFAKLLFTPAWAVIGDRLTPLAGLTISYLAAFATLAVMRQAIDARWSFWALATLRTLRCSANAIGPMTDAVMVRWSMRVPQASYGQQRVFASLAWGVGSLFVGHLIDRSALTIVYTYTYCTMLWTLLLIGFLHWRRSRGRGGPSSDGDGGSPSCVTQLPSPSPSPSPSSSNNTTNDLRAVMHNLHLLLQRPSLSRFASQIVLSGFLMTLFDSLMPMQIERDLGASRTFNGLSTLLSVLSSIPVWWYSEHVLRARGAWWMLRAGQGLMAVRFGAMAFASSDLRAVLLLTSLHGVVFASIWVAATALMQRQFAKGLAVTTSAQVLVTTLYFVLGQGVGNVFWLSLYGRLGSARMLYAAGCVVLLVNVGVGGAEGPGEKAGEEGGGEEGGWRGNLVGLNAGSA